MYIRTQRALAVGVSVEYAQYGCAHKMNDYRILAEKAGSAIKADTAYTLYQQAQEDFREINRMIAEK